MFKTLNIYRFTGTGDLTTTGFNAAAEDNVFTPCTPSQDRSVGWVPPRGEAHGLLVENPVAGHYILKLMIETKSVPGAMVKAKAQEAADEIDRTTGRKPGKKETKELREDALQALLPQAFPKQTAVWVWIDTQTLTLAHSASSQAKSDEVVTALVRTFDGLSLTAVQTKFTPSTAMAQWLLTTDPDQWPEGFSVEREVELKSADEDKATVKFNRHHLLNDEVRKHVAEGKLPTRLAMSYEGRISFVLTESLRIKKLAFLEGVFEGRDDTADAGFDADVALVTGELRPFIKALLAALDGEAQADLFGGE